MPVPSRCCLQCSQGHWGNGGGGRVLGELLEGRGDLGAAEGLLLGASQRGPSEAPQLTPALLLPHPIPTQGT